MKTRGIIARERRAAGVIAAKVGAPASPETQAIRALQDTVRRGLAREDEMLGALREALDGWQERASAEGSARIEEIRKRWALLDDPADDSESDL